jgi:hypothetical protein
MTLKLTQMRGTTCCTEGLMKSNTTNRRRSSWRYRSKAISSLENN